MWKWFDKHPMNIRSLFLGEKQTALRVVRIAVVATLLMSLPIILQVDMRFHSLRWYLWGGLIVLTLGLAVYAGRNNGGLFGAWLAVFLAVLWLYVVPPLIAHLQGTGFGDREYDTLRPSVVGLHPYDELMLGLQYGPIVALLVALSAGSIAFVLGKGIRHVSKQSSV